jgi:hypothetical protein
MQAHPIGRPDPQPRRQILQRKSHGEADARGLTGAEIAQRQLNAREQAEKKALEQQWQASKEGEFSEWYKYHLSYSQLRTAPTSNFTFFPTNFDSRRKSTWNSTWKRRNMGEASAGVWAPLVIGKPVSKA